ncbi:histidine kinase [Streptomyces sp. SID3212]|uniref:sensor histidine kinase n=1 Tax=Streptomyces sp. SID3212 TaxID=2690259 RepID=UPI001370D04E|nr:histidine kinase [Streptomyces sp. SID3212]MYV52138.1 sensor histidine kinase [Streptomyces sp. SID3212]
MSRVGRTRDPRRVVAVLRAVPRQLRDDLLGARAFGPLPDTGRPGWREWQPVVVLLTAICALFVGAMGINNLIWESGLGQVYGTLLGVLQAAALVVAVFRPVPAWWVVTLVMVVVARTTEATAGRDVLFPWTGEGMALQAGVLFLLALRVRPRAAFGALVISLLAGAACGLFVTAEHNADVMRAAAVLTVAVVVGAALRGSQVARTELVVQAGLTADERARRTLLEERNRIARELHDVVAHHMSVISIQAQVAPHLVDNPSEELRENLAGIRGNAVGALTELRRVLGVLRSEDALSESVRHAPQPTLDRLDELIGTVRGAGLAVTTRFTGEPRPLAPGVGLSAYRIVQEALSNVMRHAPGAEVRVEIGYLPSRVVVRVVNGAPARAVAPPSTDVPPSMDVPPSTDVPLSTDMGHGLLGMRERTAMLGGELATGATPQGGYEVTATLPTEEPTTSLEDGT